MTQWIQRLPDRLHENRYTSLHIINLRADRVNAVLTVTTQNRPMLACVTQQQEGHLHRTCAHLSVRTISLRNRCETRTCVRSHPADGSCIS